MILLFLFDQYYPRGGFKDFYDEYETVEEALEAASKVTYFDRYQLVSGKEVIRSGNVSDLIYSRG